MKVSYTPEDLIKFEEEVVRLFSEKKIRAPVHLDNGNEEQLIDVFRNYVNEDDWVCCSWRSHEKALLRGVPQDVMMQAILEGKSISLCFPRYRVISSAIVGGILPIALGLAMGIKRNGEQRKVVCFLGEMTSESGTFHECLKYSTQHHLPVLWVEENNFKSVCSPTKEVWKGLTYEPECEKNEVVKIFDNLLYFKYQSKYPHAGGLTRVQF